MKSRFDYENLSKACCIATIANKNIRNWLPHQKEGHINSKLTAQVYIKEIDAVVTVMSSKLEPNFYLFWGVIGEDTVITESVETIRIFDDLEKSNLRWAIKKYCIEKFKVAPQKIFSLPSQRRKQVIWRMLIPDMLTIGGDTLSESLARTGKLINPWELTIRIVRDGKEDKMLFGWIAKQIAIFSPLFSKALVDRMKWREIYGDMRIDKFVYDSHYVASPWNLLKYSKIKFMNKSNTNDFWYSVYSVILGDDNSAKGIEKIECY